MNNPELFAVAVIIIAAVAGLYSYRKVIKQIAKRKQVTPKSKPSFRTVRPHSLPIYYGWYAALWCAVPAFILAGIWMFFERPVIEAILLANLPDSIRLLPASELDLFLSFVKNEAAGIVSSDDPLVQTAAANLIELRQTALTLGGAATIVVAFSGLVFALNRVSPELRARKAVERMIVWGMMLSSLIAVLTTFGIVLSLIFESLRFFSEISVFDFLFGTEWSPQMALRADQVASTGSFGAIPIFAGTFLITLIAMSVAAPIGLYTAVYLSQYASQRFRNIVKPILEVLAGVPTVVYGFFAALTVAPLLRDTGIELGLVISSESALAAGLVMGVMIIPFVCSLSDDVISAVPRSLKEASLGLGATQAETIKKVLFPAALPGIVGALLLAVSRAVGETMIVVMAAGLAANLTMNPFQAVTTVTVQIVTLLIGDQEFDSAKTLSAFALGLVLFVLTLSLNILALRIVKKYREQYD